MRLALISLGIVACAVVIGCTQFVGTGRAVYEKDCVMCHGSGGLGDGDFAGKLLTLPPDLTVLARENGGEFPRLRVREAITGEGRGEHFSSAMPEFSEVEGHGPIADFRLEALLDYLETIQI